MHTDAIVDFRVLYSFAVALARVSGFLVFVPLPGLNAGPSVSRVVLALILTISLMPLWPPVEATAQFGDLTLWVAAEFMVGLVTGIGVAFLLEGFQVAGQAIGLQAGFSYASTVDPSTQADTAVLQTVLELFAGILFFATGLHLQLIRLLALGMDTLPTAGAVSKAFNAAAVIRLGSLMFSTGLRLAMPVIGSLLLLDLAFALLSKVHTQMQLLSLSFSAKMLAALALLSIMVGACPALLSASAKRTFEILFRLLT